MEDAEYVLITTGSMSGAAKEAVDIQRNRGIKAGLVRMRLLRPFPQKQVCAALKKAKAFGVVDKNVSFGWNTGIVYQEVKSALYEEHLCIPSVPVIGGLGGEDISIRMMEECIDAIKKAADEQKSSETICLTV